MIGLKFLLKDGHFTQALVTEVQAKEVVEKWMSGAFTTTTIGSTEGGAIWAIRVDAILAIHTFSLEGEQSKKDSPLPVPSQYPWGRQSGY